MLTMTTRQIFLIIGLCLLAACSKTEYVCHNGSTAASRDQCPDYGLYVQDYVLTLEDMPDGYIIDEEETGMQLGSEITEDDLQRGWKEGYFCGFFKPEGEVIVEAVYCFVSRYDAQGLKGIFETNESANMTFFKASVGDSSVGYYNYDAANDASSYTVEFVKDDVYAGVTMQKRGQVDLSEDVIRYAQAMASRIKE